MSSIRLKAFLGLVVLWFALFLPACANQQTLKVGIESRFKPFTYVEAGKIKGFEINLWDAIAKEAGVKYEFKPMGIGEMISSVKSGKLDAGIGGISINDARKNELVFSTPYYHTGLVMLTASDDKVTKEKKDLKNKIVATKLGTTAYDFVSEIKGVKEVRAYPDISQAYRDLMNKKADAVIFDEHNVLKFMKEQGQGKVKTNGAALKKESYAVIFKKRSRYLGRINRAIEAIGKNGTYEKIYVKWFGEKPEKLPGQ